MNDEARQEKEKEIKTKNKRKGKRRRGTGHKERASKTGRNVVQDCGRHRSLSARLNSAGRILSSSRPLSFRPLF